MSTNDVMTSASCNSAANEIPYICVSRQRIREDRFEMCAMHACSDKCLNDDDGNISNLT